jgi:heme exporter protein B
VGTALLSLIGSIGAALTLPLNREGLLLSLIVIPFYMPVLIFGSNIVVMSINGLSIASPLAVMGSLLALSLLISPYAVSCALRSSIHG